MTEAATALAAFDRLRLAAAEAETRPPAEVAAEAAAALPPPGIRFAGAGKTFAARRGQPAVAALAPLDLAIPPGSIYGVIGRSGAGKSTLVRLINLLERPSQGQVLIDGVDLAGLDAAALRRQRRAIGMIFQHFNLLTSRTVFGNVALPLELAGLERAAIEARVRPLLDLVGLADKRDRYPAQLSGGQKQRVAIARALAARPRVLLCDEATSALDPETTRQILDLLADVNRRLRITIVLITHEMGVVKQICDRVAVLDDGRLVEEGPVFEVFTRPSSATARRLVGEVTSQALPAWLTERLRARATADADSTVLRLTFAGPRAEAPVLTQVARRHGVDLNVLHGQIDTIQGRPFGSLVVAVAGRSETVIHQLEDNDVRVELLGYLA